MRSANSIVQSVRQRQYWLLGLVAALGAIYAALLLKVHDTAHLGMSIIFYLAAGTLLWEKRYTLKLQSSLFSKAIGAGLIAILLWQSFILLQDPTFVKDPPHPIVRIFPLLAGVSVSLLASGCKGLKQYWQELTILGFLGLPSILASFLPDLSPITAIFATCLLWYVGFDASVQGVYVHLPTGAIEVYAGCSGIESMTYLLGISVISLILFPISGLKRFFVPLLALLIGFGVNGVRVALLAVLAGSRSQTAFDYWHEGGGSMLFGMISIFTFGLLYILLYRFRSIANPDTEY